MDVHFQFQCVALWKPALSLNRSSDNYTMLFVSADDCPRFGVKEEYMCFMNDFVDYEIQNMKEFLNKISVSRCSAVWCTPFVASLWYM